MRVAENSTNSEWTTLKVGRELEIWLFRKSDRIELSHARIAAFGSTRQAQTAVEEDAQVKLLLDAATPVVTILGRLGFFT